MGTWSFRSFGNDSALDWLARLQESEDGQLFIQYTIEKVLNDYDGNAAVAEEAVAAIAVICASATEPAGRINKDAKSWIIQAGYAPSRQVVEIALSSLDIIIHKSELYELWSESGGLNTWIRNIDKLRSILEETRNKEPVNRTARKQGIPRTLYKLIEYYAEHKDTKIRDRIFKKFDVIENVNEGGRETNYRLPLSLAAKYGLKREIRLLLDKGADPNHKPLLGGVPFTLACVHGHICIANLLLTAGAEMFEEIIMDENSGFPYMPELYDDGEQIQNLKTYRYCKALFAVAAKGDSHTIDYLLGLGADVQQTDVNGETLIHKACRHGNTETMEHLISLGVDVNQTLGPINGAVDSRGESPLHYAVLHGQLNAIKVLLEHGANPNIVEYFTGQEHRWINTPLDLIAEYPNSEIYKLLYKYGGVLAKDLP
jgi:ankyrin repeat protein